MPPQVIRQVGCVVAMVWSEDMSQYKLNTGDFSVLDRDPFRPIQNVTAPFIVNKGLPMVFDRPYGDGQAGPADFVRGGRRQCVGHRGELLFLILAI